MQSHNALENKVNELELEMKKLGYWSHKSKAVDVKTITEPFGMGQITFEEWLQYVFIPNVRKIIEEKGKLPEESNLGYAAFKNYEYMDDMPETRNLASILREIDEIINKK